MKLSGPAAARFCREPDPSVLGVLLHGPDEGLLGLSRAELVARITEGDEMRLTRLDPAELRKDPAALEEALRARGFFPGRRVVLIEPAADSLTAALKPALADLAPEDALLVVVGPGLAGRSSLRKLFEAGKNLASVGLYPSAATLGDLSAALAEAGLNHGVAEDGLHALKAAVTEMDVGSVRQLIGKIALYGLGRTEPLSRDEIEALLPRATDSGLDVLITAVADGRAEEVGPLIARLSAAGTAPTRMLLAASAHFRNLLRLATAEGGPERALAQIRPPVWGPRRNEIVRQSRKWGAPRLESGLRLLFAAELGLRTPGQRPDRALVERTLIRLAMSAG